MNASNAKVYVGPAGWSYDDWQGIVYPEGPRGGRLTQVAALFPLIEINSSFYGSPSRRSTTAWAEQVQTLPNFRFTAKLVKIFTHDKEHTWTLKARDDFRDGVQPLLEAGVLAALLVQMPWFFASDESNLKRLGRIRKAFPDHRLVLEVRHRSWLESRWLEAISELGYSLCTIDQPLARDSLPLEPVVTGPLGYVRLHGRNADKWFDRNSKVHEKYDYFYSTKELQGILAAAQRLQERTEELYVVANNHYVGKGPANALQILHELTGETPQIPSSLLRAFPSLKELVRVG